MNNNLFALGLTLVLGIFMLFGCILAFVIDKDKSKIMDFVLGLAFSVIIMLLFVDLLPEAFEILKVKHLYLFLIFMAIGYIALRVLDNFIPDHDDNKLARSEMKDNLVHIGVVSGVALSIHNIIEGMAVYATGVSDGVTALLMSLGIGFHNIPLGMVIASTLYQGNKSKKKTSFIILFLSLSTFVGGLVMFMFGSVNEIVVGCLLALTIGMLSFIVIDELFPRIRKSKNKRESALGIISGILLILISSII